LSHGIWWAEKRQRRGWLGTAFTGKLFAYVVSVWRYYRSSILPALPDRFIRHGKFCDHLHRSVWSDGFWTSAVVELEEGINIRFEVIFTPYTDLQYVNTILKSRCTTRYWLRRKIFNLIIQIFIYRSTLVGIKIIISVVVHDY
jgi:hypothetical protein